MVLLGQIFGFIGLLFVLISIQNNKKNLILFFQIFANIFYGLQYFTLGLLSAGCMSCVSLLRCFVFYYFEKVENKRTPLYWLIILSVIPLILSCITFDGIISLIPIICTILYTYAIWQPNLKKFRFIVTSSGIGWIFYNGIGGAYVGVISAIFEFINGLIAIIRFDIRGNIKSKKDA